MNIALALTLLASLTGLAAERCADKLDDIASRRGAYRGVRQQPAVRLHRPAEQEAGGLRCGCCRCDRCLGGEVDYAPPTRPTAFRCWCCRRKLT